MFIAALVTTAKPWIQSTFPSTGEWIKKICYIFTRECYSAIKKDKIMLCTATWRQLEIFIPSEISFTSFQ